MTPDAFWAAEMQNRRLQQEQQRYDQEALMSGFSMIADAYKQKEQDKSDAKIYGQLMKVIAPAFGQNGDAVLAEYNSFKNDRDKANFGRTMVGSLGVIGNMYAQTRSAGIRENQQALTAAMPDLRNQADANNRLRQEGSVINGTALPSF